MRVDAYTATVDGDGSEVLAWLVEAVPVREQLLVGREGGINTWKYHHGVAIFDGKACVGAVRWGGNGGGCSVELKGSVAPDTFGLLRAKWPNHSCSRMDVAIDASARGLFASSFRALRAMAKSRNPKIAIEQRGDWTYREKGRTAYFGSRDSDAQVVLYEKGHEQAAKGVPNVDLEWTRLELRVHPAKGVHKRSLAALAPQEAWGWSGWTSEALRLFTDLPARRVALPERERDDERTYRALLEQYGAFLERQAPGWEQRLSADVASLVRRRRAA